VTTPREGADWSAGRRLRIPPGRGRQGAASASWGALLPAEELKKHTEYMDNHSTGADAGKVTLTASFRRIFAVRKTKSARIQNVRIHNMGIKYAVEFLQPRGVIWKSLRRIFQWRRFLLVFGGITDIM